MDSNILISWAHGAAANHGEIYVDVKGHGGDVLFALARATSGILRSMAKDGQLGGLLAEYIKMLIDVAHDDGEQLVRLDLSRKGGDA